MVGKSWLSMYSLNTSICSLRIVNIGFSVEMIYIVAGSGICETYRANLFPQHIIHRPQQKITVLLAKRPLFDI
jgi:hypothetical protein